MLLQPDKQWGVHVRVEGGGMHTNADKDEDNSNNFDTSHFQMVFSSTWQLDMPGTKCIRCTANQMLWHAVLQTA